jgi:hypothetical protein
MWNVDMKLVRMKVSLHPLLQYHKITVQDFRKGVVIAVTKRFARFSCRTLDIYYMLKTSAKE